MTIAEIYRKVCEKRTEAAVEGLFNASDTSGNECWFHPLVNGKMHRRIAEALIVHHWLTLLPEDHNLDRSQSGWSVCHSGSDEWIVMAPTPFEALAAYLLGGVE